MEQPRYKNKFCKVVNINKLNRVKTMRQDYKRKLEEMNTISSNSCEGRRIVEPRFLGQHLKCHKCKQVISLENICGEKRRGLFSILSVFCKNCNYSTLVPTGKEHNAFEDRKKNRPDVNSQAVLGALHAGIGCVALNKILACLDIPVVSESLFKRYEREIGPTIEAVAKDSCKRAAEEERTLVLNNIKNLCDQLPEEISNAIRQNLEMINLKENCSQQIDESNACMESTRTSESSMSNLSPQNNCTSNFDDVMGNIVQIIVSYDMGWSKRGCGRSYDSLNGYGALIGFLSKKILDFTTRNRKCSLQVQVLIGDEDSSTIAAIRHERSDNVFKHADTNHLNKNFSNELYNLRDFKEMKNKDTIPHIKKCFNYAVAQKKDDSVGLSKTLKEIPDHLFGMHKNCGTWCLRREEENQAGQTILLQDLELYDKLKELFDKYAKNSSEFSVAASGQGNETLNSIMAHKAPKSICYSLSESADFRFASAVCSKNEGDDYLLNVEEKLCITPGKYTKSYVERQQKIKEKKALKKQLPSTKARRNILKEKRTNLRKAAERSEGIQYQSNCGMTIDQDACEENVIIDANHENLGLDDVEIIYFDLETSGFDKNADILQIAAKSNSGSFSIYINPVQPITPSSSKVTGLTSKAGELFLRGTKVSSVPVTQALNAFYNFLCSFQKPCLLIAHNAQFDVSRFLICIHTHFMMKKFSTIIIGFTDSLSLFRKQLPGRTGKGKFKLSTLATDLLQKNSNDESFHDASYDVEILKELVAFKIPSNDLFICRQSLVSFFKRQEDLKSLRVFEKVLSSNIINKIASAGISFLDLSKAHNEDEKNGICAILSTEVGRKPRVTKCKKIIEAIIKFFKKG